eukprot:3861501-Prymnesium_polylepis.1
MARRRTTTSLAAFFQRKRGLPGSSSVIEMLLQLWRKFGTGRCTLLGMYGGFPEPWTALMADIAALRRFFRAANLASVSSRSDMISDGSFSSAGAADSSSLPVVRSPLRLEHCSCSPSNMPSTLSMVERRSSDEPAWLWGVDVPAAADIADVLSPLEIAPLPLPVMRSLTSFATDFIL